MSKRAARACVSVWERRRPRWFAGLGAALVMVVALGVVGVPSVLATGCTPVSTGAPTVSEARGVAGGTLTTSNGSWSTSCTPTSYTYQWQRSTNGGSTWSTISGATAQSYSPAGVDVEALDRAQVWGCNGSCTESDDSNSSAIYESALGLRRQYSATDAIAVDDQESLQVNVADGNLVLQANDFSLPGVAGFGYQFTRTYNSLNNTGLSLASDLSTLSNPTMAIGWSDVPSLAFFPNGDARFTGDGGYEITFTWNSANSTFTAPPAAEATLVPVGYPVATYDLTFHRTSTEEDFNSSGQLTDEWDRNRNHIAFSWTGLPPSGQLSTVTDTTGRTTTFHYTSGQMTSITAPGNCSGGLCTYSYTYNGSGQLATYTDPSGAVTTYGYNSAGLISTVQNPAHHEWSIVYDSQNRVSSITGGLDSSGTCVGVCPVTGLTYTLSTGATFCPSGMETDVTDPSGYVTTYCTDSRARVYEAKDPLGRVTSSDYGEDKGGANCLGNGETLDDQPCETEDGLGYVTQYGYETVDVAPGEALMWETSPVPGTPVSSWLYNDLSYPDQPTSYTDANGHQTLYTYDSNGNPASTTTGLDSSGNCPTGTVCPRTDTIYASNGELLTTKLGLDSTDACAANTPCSRTDNTYYASNTSSGTVGDLASTTTGLTLSDTCPGTCPETTFTYDAAGDQTSQVDPLGNVSGGNPANYTQSSTYDTDGRLLSSTDELGHVTNYSYDSAGNELTTTDPKLHETKDVYDANNWLTSEQTGLNSSGTCNSGDTCPTTSYAYFTNGDVNTTTDPNGNTTTDCYNGDHELISEYSPLAGSVTCPIPTSVTCATASSHDTQYCYDADGNQIAMLDGLGHKTVYTYSGAYSAVGEMTSEQSGLTLQSGTYQCPASPAICPTTSYSYDHVGNKLATLDPLNNETLDTYDADNRLISEQSGLNSSGSCPTGTPTPICPTTSYTYDAEGNKATVINARGYETAYTYDFAGNELSEQSGLNSTGSCPSGSTCPTTSFTYDANGNEATKTVPAAPSSPISYGYDHAGEQTSITYPSGYSTPNVYTAYDGDGNQTLLTTGTSSCSTATVCDSYTYGNTDQMTGQTTSDSSGTKSFSYTYDANGNVTGDTYPDGTVISSKYDADGNLCLVATASISSCSSNPAAAHTTYSYDQADNLKTTASITGTGTTIQTETRSYDSANFLTENKTIVGTAGGTIADVNYTLDNAGMPTTIARTGTVTTNSSTINCTVDDHYDNNEHITSAFWHTSSTCGSNSNVTYTFTWDANGNRATSNNGSTTTNYAYNNLDELCDQTTGTASCSTPNYTYNANGDQTNDSSNNYYAYNLADQLCLTSTTVPTPPSTAYTCTSTPTTYTTYSYDGNGSLFETDPNAVPANATRLLWDPNTDAGSQTALEWTGSLTSGTLAHKYVYGQDRLSETDPTTTGNPFYYTYDGLGSALDVVNDSSTSKLAYAYNTFGPTSKTLSGTTGVPKNLMGYISARTDTATNSSINLYDTTVRNLDTSTGSFTTQDPAAAPGQTAGAYAYANDNPDTYTDPNGTSAPNMAQGTASVASSSACLRKLGGGNLPHYENPFYLDHPQPKQTWVDSGVDYAPSLKETTHQAITAIGKGLVDFYGVDSSWGPFLEYQLTAGRFRNCFVYTAEHLNPIVRPGPATQRYPNGRPKPVRKGQIIARFSLTGNYSIETGWGTGVPFAALQNGANATASGCSFAHFLEALGARRRSSLDTDRASCH